MRARNLVVGCVLGFLISCGGGESKSTNKTPTATPPTQAAAATKTAPRGPNAAAPGATPQGDCPAAMAEYETFVDKYIVYMKKVSKGDLSAMSQVQSLMAQADSAGKKLADMRGDLNADCLKRYNDIMKKMTDATMEMSGASAADKAQIKEMHKASDKAIDAMGCMESCQKISDPMSAAKCMQKCM